MAMDRCCNISINSVGGQVNCKIQNCKYTCDHEVTFHYVNYEFGYNGTQV